MILNILFLFFLTSKSLCDKAPIIETKFGEIEGFSQFNTFVYLGIPYAQPPINELRWQKPQDPIPWSPNVLNATSYQPACPQSLNCDPQSNCPKSV